MRTQKIICAAIVAGIVASWFAALALAEEQPLVNVNEATAEQLAYLHGVGEKLATRIIEGRPYATAADLDAVPGIGESILEANAANIVYTGPTTARTKIDAPCIVIVTIDGTQYEWVNPPGITCRGVVNL